MLRSIFTMTTLLIWLNVAIHLFVYGYLSQKSDIALYDFMYRFGLVPTLFWGGAWWQPLTSIFIHGGLFLHIFVNMLALWSIGPPVERTIGSRAFLLLCLFSGATGSLTVVMLQPDLGVPTIGFSGAVLGLLGALGTYYPRSQLMVFFIPMRAWTAVLIFGGLSLLLIFFDKSSGISHSGHLGGLIGGVLYARVVLGLKIGRSDLQSGVTADRAGPFRVERVYMRGGPGQGGPGQAWGGPANRSVGERDVSDRGVVLDRESEVAHDAESDRPGSGEIEVLRPDEVAPPASSSGAGGVAGRRLYFDPRTGRFELRD